MARLKSCPSRVVPFPSGALPECPSPGRALLAQLEGATNQSNSLGGGAGGGWSGSLGEQFVHPVRHLGALRHPVLDAITLQFDASRIRAGIIGPDHFHRTAVAGALLLNHHNAIVRLFARTSARQTNH